jgi:hypothetical protein
MVSFWEDLFGFILAYKEQKQDSKISTFSATSPSYGKVFNNSAQVQHKWKWSLRGKTGKFIFSPTTPPPSLAGRK